MEYYPVFLNVKDKKAVIVGGGKVAERKALTLIKAGALVTVVSPNLTGKLVQLKTRDLIQHIPRLYQKKDIHKAFVVIAATDSPDINARISRDAGGLVNVVDVPPLCNFIAPSIVRRGPLTLAISTSGSSPALAKTIRKELELLYGPEIGQYLKFLTLVREKSFLNIPEAKAREKFLKGLASAKTLHSLRSKGFEHVREKVLSQLESMGKSAEESK